MSQDIKEQLDRMETFLQKHMVTKEEFSELKLEVSEVKESVSKLITSVDGLVKLVKDMLEEHTSMKHQLLMMQDWMRKAADKVGIEFKL